MEHAVLPSHVLLKDYNYRKPQIEMKANAAASPEGFGTYYSYGDHFKTPDEGHALAAVRAEEILCRVKTWQGTSGVLNLEPALMFILVDHPLSGWNGRYMVVSVTHTGYQPGAGAKSAHLADDLGYRNNFTAIRADTQWRPERITPKPRICGVMHATIDGETSGQYAEIDAMGRYKVKLPFDLSDSRDGKASRFIRMAQPYSGAEYGMHFPLHKGVEVLLAHLDGDPDRPIIVGSVPNPDTASPVTGGNNTQCAIHTGGGNKITIEDTEGTQRIALCSPTSSTFFTMGASR
jgi:type VI secretion system secreted protein VgrG